MAINISKGCEPYKFKCPHDKDSEIPYTFTYRPKPWSLNKEYIKGIDVVLPTTPNGMSFIIESGGISGVIEPEWVVSEGATTKDNTVLLKAQAYDYLLSDGDSIIDSTWIGDTGTVFIDDSIIAGIQTSVTVTAVPADSKSITITNRITVLRVNGKRPKYDRSMILKIKQT